MSRRHHRNSGDDTINGNSGNNYINGGRGNDTINGNGGHDWLVGGRGNDMVNGGDGCDVVFGGSGNDTVDGGNGNDWVFGGSGSDMVIGGAGSDAVFAGRGDDEAIYNMERNVGAHDYYSGGRGNDTLTLEFTVDEWARADVRADVENYLQALEDQANSTSWWHRNASFTFEAFGLTVRSFENLKVVVDGEEIDPTATNADPTYNGGVLSNSATGNLAVDPLATQDLKDFFDDADGDTLTFTAASLPDGLTLTSDGLLQQSATFDPTDLSLVGDNVFTVTVDDGNGGTIDQDLSFTVALNNDFGADFGILGGVENVVGSGIDDTITFRFGAGFFIGTVNVDAGDGDDAITFGDSAGSQNGTVNVNAGEGDDTINFGNGAGLLAGTVNVNAGNGDDEVGFGSGAGNALGTVVVDTGEGDDTIGFGDAVAQQQGTIEVFAGAGADTITFGDGAARSVSGAAEGTIIVDLGMNDMAADTLVFEGSIFNATIRNWEAGIDTVDVVDPTAWSGNDDGTDTTFTTTDGQSITFEGISGMGADFDDFLI